MCSNPYNQTLARAVYGQGSSNEDVVESKIRAAEQVVNANTGTAPTDTTGGGNANTKRKKKGYVGTIAGNDRSVLTDETLG